MRNRLTTTYERNSINKKEKISKSRLDGDARVSPEQIVCELGMFVDGLFCGERGYYLGHPLQCHIERKAFFVHPEKRKAVVEAGDDTWDQFPSDH